jgi:hypothetical protein
MSFHQGFQLELAAESMLGIGQKARLLRNIKPKHQLLG